LLLSLKSLKIIFFFPTQWPYIILLAQTLPLLPQVIAAVHLTWRESRRPA
jgi:hypothetical protein